MRTLVGEGIGAFIVVKRWHLLMGLEVLSFLESLRSAFYGILSLWESSWILRSVESKLFPYIRDTWVASNHWSVPSAFNAPPALTLSAPWGRQSHEGVSLRVPFKLLVASFPMMNIMETDGPEICCQSVSSSSTYVVAVKHQLTHGYSIYLFFFHISYPLLHNLIDFKLTDLWSLVKLLFWAQRSRKIIWLIPRSEMHLMPKTCVDLPLAPFFMMASLYLLRIFPSYIYSTPSLYFLISFCLIFERETERDCRFWLHRFSFYFHHFICCQSSGFSSKNHFNSKFLFLLHIIYL